jgi:pSer/pThr/pTyr-binding forkhead associated (FHA) protein
MSSSTPVAPPPPSEPPACRVCATPLYGRFCERCGHDSAAQAGWQAVVRADRARFEEARRQNGAGPAALPFPHDAPTRRYELSGERMAIGRSSSRTRATAPEIDLADLDPGVSATHAELRARPDGGWDLVDLGSTNGTTVAGDPIPAHVPVPLAVGTVVRLGAWTTITVAAGQSR